MLTLWGGMDRLSVPDAVRSPQEVEIVSERKVRRPSWTKDSRRHCSSLL